ncbi:MAG: CDP-alcohol phosphatidyltransferase family protein [Gemmatimonadetes bacterium]|nr:CDP-alcohol phosphatidyltransferase family protein [Gemmatimonadota bacterium]
MLDHALRPIKDRVLDPVARPLGLRVSPSAVTILALATGLLAAAALATQRYGLALAAWLCSRVLDGLDGALARKQGRQSDWGGYLDILADFFVYAAVPTALVLGRPLDSPPLIALSLLLAAFYMNAASWMYLAAILEKRSAGAAARGEQTTVSMPDGVVGGTETIVFYCAFILLPQHVVPLFGAMAALVGVSVLQRLLWAARHLAPDGELGEVRRDFSSSRSEAV